VQELFITVDVIMSRNLHDEIFSNPEQSRGV